MRSELRKTKNPIVLPVGSWNDFYSLEYNDYWRREVGGEFFDCSHNQLTSLIGCPNYVEGDFYCYNNQLTSLEGVPNYIGGHFSCRYNPLPQEIIDNPKAELLKLQRESKINSLLDEY
jgi:hypothetical protein